MKDNEMNEEWFDLNETTPWYPPEIKPARKGMYQKLVCSTVCWSYWSGRHWGWTCAVKKDAYRFRSIRHKVDIEYIWRGLLSRPVVSKDPLSPPSKLVVSSETSVPYGPAVSSEPSISSASCWCMSCLTPSQKVRVS